MDVKSLRHQAAIQILSALIVEDHIGWYTEKDPSCFGVSQFKLIETAVDMAYGLVEELAKRDPVLASQLRSEQQVAELNQKLGIVPPQEETRNG